MKPALNLPNTALAILFVLLLFAPMATQLLSLADGRSTDTGENRTLSSAPGLPDTLDGWIAYPATVERYYRDNFALRAPLLNTANILKLTLGIDLAPHYDGSTQGRQTTGAKRSRCVQGEHAANAAAAWRHRYSIPVLCRSGEAKYLSGVSTR